MAAAAAAPDVAAAAREAAEAIQREDEAASAALARHGADALDAALPAGPVTLMTHCNSGALAASGRGTGLGVIAELADRRDVRVLACEARPLLQGARLTVWELRRLGIEHSLLVDAAAPGLLRTGAAHAVVTGFDRVAANGDVANKVGTYGLALAAGAAGVPFMAAGPSSSIDLRLASGDAIEIEERDADEVRAAGGALLTVAGTAVPQPGVRRHARRARVGAGDRARRRVAGHGRDGREGGVRVALTVSPGDTRIEERPDPVCGPGDVVCRVLACATCKSDVGWYVTRKLPGVLGHEPAGEVVELGADVSGLAVGDRVAIHHHAPCGECRRCLHGHETLCERFRGTALDPGGFAEYVRIEADLVEELLPLDGLDPVAATVTEPLGCALRAQERAGIRAGDSLLVVGAGCSGLLHVAAAHARGVEAVWVREPDGERLARAEAWGATAHGNEPVDVAMVCTESPQAIAGAAEALAPGGTLCLYAPPAPGDAARRRGLDRVLARAAADGELVGGAGGHASGARRCCGAAPCRSTS